MSRCVACNKPFNDHEMTARNPITKLPEDLCRKCINSIWAPEYQADPDDMTEIWKVVEKLDKKDNLW